MIRIIYDLMIDLKRGEVLYAFPSHRGFWVMGNDYYAVPILARAFSDRDEDITKIDVNKEVL